ncbi:trimeric intracellular cation channel family protein [Robiginitalea sp. SC105]|uniref:trimeric intracellular cation channel family protein n=1 Tax=Robiginitalea sp. SC105 TaxID=2762332 RepID=UPI00163B3C01|nr:trimeric intracellular cation channel family protein [Robiginitalea sp. SC105]MBC2840175.1 trimeric intracellular cation channel family protein [Robiginitalea sp. SC105]
MLYTVVDLLGVIAFAISGVLVAMEKRLDLFGVGIIALVTSIGGGTLRDLLLGYAPVDWMRHPHIVYVILLTTTLAVLFQSRLKNLRTSLFLFDTIGIGLYTLVGIEKGLDAGLSPVICIALGTITACFGGVLRDILCNEIPVIFRREIYASACIAGGGLYFLFVAAGLSAVYAYVGGIAAVILIRLLAVRFGIGLPNLYRNPAG